MAGSSVEDSVEKPAAVIPAAKNPETIAEMSHDHVVVTLDVGRAPPAGLDTFRAPGAMDPVVFSRPAEPDRRTIWNERHGLDRQRSRPEAQRPTHRRSRILRTRNASRRTATLPFGFHLVAWRDHGIEAVRIFGLGVRDQGGPRHRFTSQAIAQAIDQRG